MSSRATLRAASVVAALLAVATGPGATAQEASTRARVPPTPVDYDLKGIRDIFRYADEAAARPGPGLSLSLPRPAEDGEENPEPPSRVRLVGLVDRADGLVAALAVDGEVVLLAEGDSAAGFTVVGLGEEAVVVRTPEGEDLTLVLP